MFRKLLRMSLVFFVPAFAAHAKAQTQTSPYLLAYECQAKTDTHYNGFQANLANVDGCVHSIKWSAIETSQGNYDFVDYLDKDSHFTPYIGEYCGGNLRATHLCYIVPVIWVTTNGGSLSSSCAEAYPALYSAAWAIRSSSARLRLVRSVRGDKGSGSGTGNSRRDHVPRCLGNAL